MRYFLFLALLFFFSGCASTPEPVPVVERLGWYGEKLPPGLERRMKSEENEPPLRKTDGTLTANPEEAKEYLRLKDRAVMVYIPAGEFLLGCHNWDGSARKSEKPQLKIFLKSCYMDKYEVTARQFSLFAKATNYQSTAEKAGVSFNWNGKKWDKIQGLSWKTPWSSDLKINTNPFHPAIHISYPDATAYAQWAGAQIPTEVQWEKAARGKDARSYPWNGEYVSQNFNGAPSQKWNLRGQDGFETTAPVGAFPQGSSPYGCMDMLGNVWEWCQDFWDEQYYFSLEQESRTNPKVLENPSQKKESPYHLIRGGGWTPNLGGDRITSRGRNKPEYTAGDLGFRCLVEGVE